MSNKLSDQPKRIEKVKRLKAKILREVSVERSSILHAISCNDGEPTKQNILELSWLYAMEEYINHDLSFMGYHSIHPKYDNIAYIISDDKIDAMLYKDFNFVLKFMFIMEHLSTENIKIMAKYSIGMMLNDKYISDNLVSIIDLMACENSDNHSDSYTSIKSRAETEWPQWKIEAYNQSKSAKASEL